MKIKRICFVRKSVKAANAVTRHKVPRRDLHQGLHHRLVANGADRTGDLALEQLAAQVAARWVGHRHGCHQAAV
jgi:hypothetical protein